MIPFGYVPILSKNKRTESHNVLKVLSIRNMLTKYDTSSSYKRKLFGIVNFPDGEADRLKTVSLS